MRLDLKALTWVILLGDVGIIVVLGRGALVISANMPDITDVLVLPKRPNNIIPHSYPL